MRENRKTFEKLFEYLQKLIKKKKIWCEIGKLTNIKKKLRKFKKSENAAEKR